jgi:EF-hand domain-containing protein 1
VLKFYVFSDIPYIMHYYLADDTIEIKEVNYPNSGRDAFSMMLRRQKLPRKFSLNQPGQTYAEDFIRPQDIQHGQVLLIYNRK